MSGFNLDERVFSAIGTTLKHAGGPEPIPGQFAPRHMRLNVMCVGESGLGKTTFLRALFKRYVDVSALIPDKPVDQSTTYSGPLFESAWATSKTVRVQEIGRAEGQAVDGHTRIHFTAIDTPGYGDFVNNEKSFKPILECILERNVKYQELLLAQSYVEAIDDPRIHCCFYFIMPHRMKDLDILFMYRLQQYVCIVPIIAKADTMTCGEKLAQLNRVQRKCDQYNIRHFTFSRPPTYVQPLSNHYQIFNRTSASHSRPANVDYACEDSSSQDTVRFHSDSPRPVFPSEMGMFPFFMGADTRTYMSCERVSPESSFECNTPTKAIPNPPIIDLSKPSLSAPARHTYTDTHTYPDIHTHTDTHTYPDVHTHTDTHTYPDVHTHTDTHTDMHTQPLPRIFAVICDEFSTCREYPWGVAMMNNPLHSDFPLLSYLLWESDAVNQLIAGTNVKYSNYWKMQQKQKHRLLQKRKANMWIYGGFVLLFLGIVITAVTLGLMHTPTHLNSRLIAPHSKIFPYAQPLSEDDASPYISPHTHTYKRIHNPILISVLRGPFNDVYASIFASGMLCGLVLSWMISYIRSKMTLDEAQDECELASFDAKKNMNPNPNPNPKMPWPAQA